MAPKAGSPGAVLGFLRNHFKNHPEEAAPLMLAVQAGVYQVDQKAEVKIVTAKTVDRLPLDFMTAAISVWMPNITPKLWFEIQNAVYDGVKDDGIVKKIFTALTCASASDAVPTQKRSLLEEILTAKRASYASRPAI